VPALLAYHVLIIGGVALLLWAAFDGAFLPLLLGVGLLVAGLAVHVGVLVWTGSSSAAWSGHGSEAHPAAAARANPPTVDSHRCPSCAWKGHTTQTVCPQCGHFVLPSGRRAAG
jgi:hypothetical protein